MCACWGVRCFCGYYRRKYDVIDEQLTKLFAGSGQKWKCYPNTQITQISATAVSGHVVEVPHLEHIHVKAEVVMSAVVKIISFHFHFIK